MTISSKPKREQLRGYQHKIQFDWILVYLKSIYLLDKSYHSINNQLLDKSIQSYSKLLRLHTDPNHHFVIS